MLSDILHPLPNNIWGLKDKTLIIPKVIRQNWYEHFICVIKNANNTTLLCHLAFGIIAKIYENTVEIETPSKPSPQSTLDKSSHWYSSFAFFTPETMGFEPIRLCLCLCVCSRLCLCVRYRPGDKFQIADIENLNRGDWESRSQWVVM